MVCPFLVFFLQKHLAEVNVKFSKFQRPADFEPKLSHVKRELDNIQERIYLLEIRSDDVESLQQKHDTCMVCTVMIPTFRTDRSGQKWTQIRLTLNRGCTVCHSFCILLMMKKQFLRTAVKKILINKLTCKQNEKFALPTHFHLKHKQ